MDTVMDYSIIWTTGGSELLGHDIHGEELIKVTTGGTHWDFIFIRHGGFGKVRVGAGCRYNPLAMIEQMHSLLLNEDSIESDIEMSDDLEFSDSLGRRWE